MFFFFNDTATTEIYTLSLHDALPIYVTSPQSGKPRKWPPDTGGIAFEKLVDRCQLQSSTPAIRHPKDRKSTRLNSSHGYISYAVFCLKKKKINDSVTDSPQHNTHRLR